MFGYPRVHGPWAAGQGQEVLGHPWQTRVRTSGIHMSGSHVCRVAATLRDWRGVSPFPRPRK